MRFGYWLAAGLALLMAACSGERDQVTSTDVAADAAEVAPEAAAIDLPDNPHPAELATYCLRVLGALTEGPHVDRCKAERLWALVTERRGVLGESCMFHRMVLNATVVAKDTGIIPQGGAWIVKTILAADACAQEGSFIRLAPFPFSEPASEPENEVAFISFALRAIGEDRKWSIIPTLDRVDSSGLCEAFEVATVESLRRQAGEALGCDW